MFWLCKHSLEVVDVFQLTNDGQIIVERSIHIQHHNTSNETDKSRDEKCPCVPLDFAGTGAWRKG